MLKVILLNILFLSLTYSFGLFANDNDLIEEINKAKTTWTAEASERFVDFSMESLQTLMGAKEIAEEERSLYQMDITPRNDLPKNFDLRKAYPKCKSLKEIRDQGSCGSCWAFSTSQVMSDRICIHSNQRLQTRISALQLVSCCSLCGNGCFGGSPFNSLRYYKESGLPSGGLYGDKTTCKPYPFPPCDHRKIPGPYNPCDKEYRPTPQCTSTCIPEYNKTIEEDLRYGLNVYSIKNDEVKTMTDLYENGPVSAVMTVYEDFIVYKSGVYQHVTGTQLGGHAIKIIGWGVEKGVKYWLCVNSWNDSWGDKGLFKILRGVNHAGIESAIASGLPKFNNHSDSIFKIKTT